MRRVDLVRLLESGLGCMRAQDRVAGHETSVLVADLTLPEYSDARIVRRCGSTATIPAAAGEKGKFALCNGKSGEKTGVLLVLRQFSVYCPTASYWFVQGIESIKATGGWLTNNGNFIDKRINGNAVGTLEEDTAAAAVSPTFAMRHSHTELSLEIKLPAIIPEGWCVICGGSVDNATVYADAQWDEVDVPQGT